MFEIIFSFWKSNSIKINIEENKNYNDFIELYNAYKNKIEEQSDVTLISIKDEHESARDFEKRIITRWFLFCKREKDWILLNLDLNQDLLTLIKTKPNKPTFNDIINPFFTKDRIDLTKAGFIIIKEYWKNEKTQVTRFIPIKKDCLFSQIFFDQGKNFKSLSFFWVNSLNPFFKDLDVLSQDYSKLVSKLQSENIVIKNEWNQISGIDFDLQNKDEVQNLLKSLNLLKKEEHLNQTVYEIIKFFIDNPLSENLSNENEYLNPTTAREYHF